MATSDGNSMYKNIRGKVGDVVSYPLFDQMVHRVVGERKSKFSENELAHHDAMKPLNYFLATIISFCRAGFELEAKGTRCNAYNMVVKANFHTVKGKYKDQYIEYSEVLVSKGKMPVVKEASVKTTEEGLDFSWSSEFNRVNRFANDQTMLLVYFPEKGYYIYELAGEKRLKGAESLLVPESLRKMQAHVYISFISSDRKSISDSLYLGEMSWN